jgi:hypothetical protein
MENQSHLVLVSDKTKETRDLISTKVSFVLEMS